MTTVLSVSNLCGGYSEVDILRGVDLNLEEGRIVTLRIDNATKNSAHPSNSHRTRCGVNSRGFGDFRLRPTPRVRPAGSTPRLGSEPRQ